MKLKPDEFETWAPISVVDEHLGAMDEAVWSWSSMGLLARVVRGSRMASRGQVFGELAAALQFPWYFGSNFDALWECLTQMDTPAEVQGVVIVVTSPELVFSDEPDDVFAILRELLADAASSRELEGVGPVSPPVRVVICTPDAVEGRRWTADHP